MSHPFAVPAPPPRRPEPVADPAAPAAPDLEALVRSLDDLADRPVSEHHDQLAAVHEALHAALHQPTS